MNRRTMLFRLELKRIFKAIPSMLFGMVLFAAIILGLSLVSFGVQKSMDKDYNRYHIAIVDTEENKYTDFAIQTIEDMDALKKNVVFEKCTRDKALSGLKQGAYDFAFIIPKKFISDMMYGNETKIEIHYGNYQNTVATYVVASLSDVATSYVENSEKSIFAMKDYMRAHGISDVDAADLSLTVHYISRLLQRNEIYQTDYLTPTDNIPFPTYYFCVGLILLFLLLGLQCAKILSGYHRDFERKLYVAKMGSFVQILTRYCSLLISFGILYLIIIIGVAIFKTEFLLGTIASIFVLIPICALLIFIFELVENTANAILTLFVVIVGLGFFSGYLFPLSMLPQSFFYLSKPTITRVMLEYVKGCVCGGNAPFYIPVMFIHSIVLFWVAVLIRQYKIKH